jgi:hypothetical protein
MMNKFLSITYTIFLWSLLQGAAGLSPQIAFSEDLGVRIWGMHLKTAKATGAREQHLEIIEDRIKDLKAEMARDRTTECLQKVIWSDAVNCYGKACLIMDNPVARASLLRMVTGQVESKDAPQTVEEIAALLVKYTGMAVDPNVVLIPLQMSDSPCADSNQLWDPKLRRSIEISRYWPYAWFVDAVDGNVPEVPLWGGRFLARLYLAPQEGSVSPFHICAAIKAAKCLAKKEDLSNGQVADVIKQYYDIDIEGLKHE